MFVYYNKTTQVKKARQTMKGINASEVFFFVAGQERERESLMVSWQRGLDLKKGGGGPNIRY